MVTLLAKLKIKDLKGNVSRLAPKKTSTSRAANTTENIAKRTIKTLITASIIVLIFHPERTISLLTIGFPDIFFRGNLLKT
jgi:hypothetical protein